MSPKKKKKDPAAQQLIDSLLDEQTAAPRLERDVTESVHLADPSLIQTKQKQTRQSISFPNDEAVSILGKELNMDDTPHFGRSQQAVANDVRRSTPHPTPHSSIDEVTATAAGVKSSSFESAKLELESTHNGDEKTVRLDSKKVRQLADDATMNNPPAISLGAPESPRREHSKAERSAIDRAGITELKTVVKMRDRFGGGASPGQGAKSSTAQGGGGGPAFTSPDAALKQSENLRIAQSRITELEQELERIRRENEQLGTAGETLRRRSDELLSKVENFELQQKELERIHTEEKKVYRGQLQSKDRENADMRGRLEEMENRLESNFKKIRVRERELEHRLEIVRMESQTLVTTKDKMILELKRHVDQITLEGDYAKQKSQEMFNQYKDKQETIRRVVRALRIALTILEGDEDATGMKKAE
jgi:hypothetical protein